MPRSCATKTLLLAPGTYSGPQNTRIALGSNVSVVIIGPTVPVLLRTSADGAAVTDAEPTLSLDAAVATIDGAGTEWLFAVGGNATLMLANLTLTHGRGAQFNRGDGTQILGGGALRVTGNGVANITGVLFESNDAMPTDGSSLVGEGGALFCSSKSALSLSGCTFRNNSATYGGALCLRGASAAMALVVKMAVNVCLFKDNVAARDGGAIYNRNAVPQFSGCSWWKNFALYQGGGVYVYFSGTGTAALAVPSFDWCSFVENGAGTQGGGLYVQEAAPRFSRCKWRLNYASKTNSFGGGVMIMSQVARGTKALAPVFDDCLIESNRAENGGGTFIQDCAPSFRNCTFRNNTSTSRLSGGGGTYIYQSALDNFLVISFDQCGFDDNSATGSGGALYTFVLVADTPSNLAFEAGKCEDFSCVRPQTTAIPPPAIQGTFRKWIPRLRLHFSGDTSFHGNRAELGSGGALSLGSGGSLMASGTVSFRDNRAGLFGGAAYLAAGTATLMLNGSNSTWMRNTAYSARGDHVFSESGGDILLGDAVMVLNGDPRRVREGLAAPRAGNVLWGKQSSALCESGFTLSASTSTFGPERIRIFQSWVLTGSSNGTAGFRPGSNCPRYFAHCTGGPSKVTYSTQYNDPKATPVFPKMRTTRVTVGCVACGATEWSDAADPLPGPTIAAATDASPLQSTCVLCIGGSTCAGGGSAPVQCTAGEFCPPGSSAGQQCSAGNFCPAGSHRGTPCPPGTTCAVGAESAALCKAGSYCHANSSVSIPCPPGTISREGSASCSKCPAQGVVCALGSMSQKAGWWRSAAAADAIDSAVRGDLSSALFPCFTDSCVGTAEDSVGMPLFDAQCKEGHSGPVCMLCATGYTMQASGTCTMCSGLNAQEIVCVLLLLLAVAGLFTFAYRKRNTRFMQPAIFKITLGFFQLVSIMEHTFVAEWPPAYRSTMHGIKFALASVADLPSTACVVTVNWYQRLCIWTFGIMFIASGLWCHYRWQRTQRNGASNSASKQRDELFRRLFYLAFFCYPLATPVIVSVFDCRTVAGTPYLDADYSLTCEGSTYALAAMWAALWTVSFVLGFPVAVAVALKRDYGAVDFLVKDYVHAGSTMQRLWEVVDLVKKMLLSSAVLFVPEGSIERIAIALQISVTFQVLQAFYQPYNSLYKNRMADAAGAALSLTYFLTLLVKALPIAQDKHALGVMLILLTVFVVLACAAAIAAMKRHTNAVMFKGGVTESSAGRAEASKVEMRSTAIANPAYELEVGDDCGADEDELSAKTRGEPADVEKVSSEQHAEVSKIETQSVPVANPAHEAIIEDG
jgi:predicted outer membrane repeat protein